MELDWCKCKYSSRCRLNHLKLDNNYFDGLVGVFVIWSGNDMKNIVKIGKGIIRDRLFEERKNKKIQVYGPDIFVTWAIVPNVFLEGIESYLNNILKPVIQNNVNSYNPIIVNLP